jgi:hypothetical protein
METEYLLKIIDALVVLKKNEMIFEIKVLLISKKSGLSLASISEIWVSPDRI